MHENAQKFERKTTFSKFWNWKQAQEKVNRYSKKKRKGEDGKAKEKKNEKSKDVGHFFYFCACPSKNVIKRDVSGKKGMLSCCKCLFE